MTAPVKVGLVGAGPWANMVHAPILAGHPDTELHAIWARRADAAAELAGKHGAAAAGSFDALLDEVDAVAFCVPPDVQAELAVVAAKAGKTLLLEKPIALDLASAQRLVDAIDESGVGSIVLLSYRYSQSVHDFFAQCQAIGPLLGGRAAMVSGAFKPGSPFATPWRLENGALPDLGPHVIDLVDGALGGVVGVKASGAPLGWVSLVLEHESGATSTVDLCASAGVANSTTVDIYGENGSAHLDGAAAVGIESMMTVPAALAAVARGEATTAPDARRGLHLQRILEQASAQLR